MQSPTAPGRRARRLPPRAWTIAISFVLFLWGGTAAAQLAIGTFSRTRSHTGYPYWISRADCLSTDDIFTFPLSVPSSYANKYYLEVWVSKNADCTTYQSRNPNQTPMCERIDSVSGGNIQSTQLSVKLTSRQIVDAMLNIGATTDTTVEPCTTSGVSDGQAVQVWFLLMTTAQDDVGAGLAVSFPTQAVSAGMKVDLVAPVTPTGVEVVTAEAALSVTISGAQSGGDLAGHYIYCDPPPESDADSAGGCGCGTPGADGAAGASATTTTTTTTTAASPAPPGTATDTGTTTDTPTDTGTTTSTATDTGTMTGTATGTGTTTTTATTTVTATATTGAGGGGGAGGAGGEGGAEACTTVPTEEVCTSCVLVPGEVPPEVYRCGTISGTGSQGTAGVLINGITHAVGVAAFDNLGNVSELSVLDCGTPAQVSDFYESYREAGGKGGGGCSVPSRFRGVSLGAPLLVLAASISLALRRRKRGPATSRRTGADR